MPQAKASLDAGRGCYVQTNVMLFGLST